MTNKEIVILLMENGYAIHPIYKFYHIPKKNLGWYFYADDKDITIGKIKWNQIHIAESKIIKASAFIAHNYGLTTQLDRKQVASMMKRMAVTRAKAKAMKEKGFIDPKDLEPEMPKVKEIVDEKNKK
jgi:hypothetical protein